MFSFSLHHRDSLGIIGSLRETHTKAEAPKCGQWSPISA